MVLSAATVREYLKQKTISAAKAAGSGRYAEPGWAAGTAKRSLKCSRKRSSTG